MMVAILIMASAVRTVQLSLSTDGAGYSYGAPPVVMHLLAECASLLEALALATMVKSSWTRVKVELPAMLPLLVSVSCF